MTLIQVYHDWTVRIERGGRVGIRFRKGLPGWVSFTVWEPATNGMDRVALPGRLLPGNAAILDSLKN